ncbi:MAG TPA: M20/M25/M40 family metallo-hydrolase [Gammaproteobacteria bacterium]|nr:M20/M25/M40 family metallo-hydrolase [Gammaproteobacteria bacterium]
MLVKVCSMPAFSQSLVHHDLTVQLFPDDKKIQVIDKIDLLSVYEKRIATDAPIAFLIHAGGELRVIEQNIKLRKRHYSFAKKTFPTLIGDTLKVGSVPVDVYSVEMSQGKARLTLEYEREIYHAVESGGKEYDRAIRSSAGLISRQGVFIAKESFWFPVFGDELVTFNLNVESPLKWKSVSQGKRLYADDNAMSHRDTWQEKHPQDDIYLVAAQFTEYSQTAGSVNTMAFLRTADDALAQKYLDTTAEYLAMYRNLLGPYPYSKFALVENFWETGFGMPSFTLLGPRIIRFPFILHSSYPHELLHNWWGNSVYVDYKKGNWAEGLTSYLADHLIKEQRGKGAEYRRAALQKYTNFTNAENDFPLTQFVSRFDAVTEAVGYGKTLMFFHMLRQQLGDENFVRGLQAFYRQYRYKTASFEDIEKVFAKVAKSDLQAFFEQWIAKVGAPNLAMVNARTEKLESGDYRLRASVRQTQAGEPYHLDVPVVVTLENQKSARQIRLKMTQAAQVLDIRFKTKPLRIDIDPAFDVFRRLNINETPPALSQVFGAKQSLIVLPANSSPKKLLAYEQLAKRWLTTQPGDIVIEYDKNLSRLPNNKSIWLLGWENTFRPELEQALSVYKVKFIGKRISLVDQTLDSDNASIVLIGRNPAQNDSSIGLISADAADAIPGLARKLPHYGKYSYLAFEGSEPSNQLKGQWPVVNSPLTSKLSENSVDMGLLHERTALAAKAPIFSEQRLLDHVRQLASKAMQGRGLGTASLDKAADYIAAEFRAAGLQPILPTGGYFQDWQQDVNGIGATRLRNVIAYLPGNNPKDKDQSVVVSAHYDHLGLGWPDVRKGNQGKIHYGADDNASGVSVLLELARSLAKKGQLPRSVIFVAFSGEEAGRLGSRHFVNNFPQFPRDDIFAAVNLDTVGRLGDKPLLVFGTGSASEWVHIFRGVGFVTGVAIKALAKDFGSSDQTSFHEIKLPAVQFFSGVNADFHKPGDTADKIDGAGLVKVATALKETVMYLTERELPLNNLLTESHMPRKAKRPQHGRRVSLGTVPDFTYQGEGVLVADVVPGSPAARAKVKANDILIEVNGRAVVDLRGFSAILRALSPGDEVSLKLLREQQAVYVKAKVVAR